MRQVALSTYHWPVAHAARPHAHVLIVHGLGEHAQRYAQLAGDLNAAGFGVSAYDQYGHGHSAGKRGDILENDHLLDDLEEQIRATRMALDRQYGTGVPLVVLGHSMGGLVLSDWVLGQTPGKKSIAGVVLSSPALSLRLSKLQKFLLHTVPLLLPHLTLKNGLEVPGISRDATVVQAYRDDTLVHEHISPIMGQQMYLRGIHVLAQAGSWDLPTLLMWGQADRIVDPAGSRTLAARIPVHLLNSHAWEDHYHEIFNEPPAERAAVVQMLLRWLRERVLHTAAI